MANICENTMHITTSDNDNISYIKNFMRKHFNVCDIFESGDGYYEVSFDSKWTFPEKEMDKMYKGLPNKGDIDIGCLSVEWGCYYCQFTLMDGDGWHE